MSPIKEFLEGTIQEEELFLRIEQILSSGSEADRTLLLADWRTKSGLIKAAGTRRLLDEKVGRFSLIRSDAIRQAHPEHPADAAPNAGRGRVLAGRFVLEEKIGSGGMSEVYRCRDLRREEAQDRNPYIALKILKPHVLEREDSIKILQREARKAQNLAHPNIVRVYDFDRDGDTLYVTMELLSGRSLDDEIAANRPHGTSLEAVLPVLRQVASALQFAHQEGIIHSDLKPSNIIVQPDGRVKLIDFGIARARSNPNQLTSDRTTFDVHALGAMTPAYASPEMIEGAPPDPRDDVFALACIIYELLTGQHPFARMPATLARSGHFRPAPPPNLSKRQWAGLQAGLQFDRARRARTPDDLLARLVGPSKPTGLRSKAGLAAAAIICVLVGAAAALYVRHPGALLALVGRNASPAHVARPNSEKAAVNAARQQAAQKAAEEAAKQQAAQKAAEEAAKQQAAQKAAEEAAKQQAAQKAAEEAAKQQAAQEAAEEAAKQQAAQRAVEEAAKQQAAQQAAEEAAKQQAAQVPEQQIGPDQVAQAQTKLNVLGFDSGPVDGKLGPKTREMIRAFQAASGMPQTGDLTEGLLRSLDDTTLSPKVRAKTLFRMAEAAQARHLDQDALRLYELGLKLDPTDSVAAKDLAKLRTNDAQVASAAHQATGRERAGPGGLTTPDHRAPQGSSQSKGSATSSCPQHAICPPKSEQQWTADAAPSAVKSPQKGPFDGEYGGVFRAGWFYSGGCPAFKRTVIVLDNVIYVHYQSAEISTDIKSDGSFKGTGKIYDMNMAETISGKIIGNKIDVRTSNILCTYHAVLTKYP